MEDRCIRFPGLQQQTATALITRETYLLTVLGVQQVYSPSGGCRGEAASGLLQLPVAPGVPWSHHSDLCICGHKASLLFSVAPHLSLVGTLASGFRAHPDIKDDLISR